MERGNSHMGVNGNSVLTVRVFHGLAANLGFLRAYFTLLGILRLQG